MDPAISDEEFMKFTTKAAAITNCNMSFYTTLGDKRFRSHFGVSLEVAFNTWISLQPMRSFGSTPTHYLIALNFLKTYDSEYIIATRFGITEKTVRRWIWYYVNLIAKLDVVHC